MIRSLPPGGKAPRMSTLPSLASRFEASSAAQRRAVHFGLAQHAASVWQQFIESKPDLAYVESVVGTRQTVDPTLPHDALRSALRGEDLADVERRYLEPIAALQDSDLELPDNVTYAYYAIYNLFRKYAQGRDLEDWLIVNQALSSETDATRWVTLLEEALTGAERL